MKLTKHIVVISIVVTGLGSAILPAAAGEGSHLVALGEARPVPARFEGPPALAAALEGHAARPLSLTSADFDEDGVPDLACGYGLGFRGIVTIHRGNVDAIYPNAPEAKQRKADGTFVDAPFRPDAGVFETPEPADFIGAGDFDADGHWDVVTAREGGTSLWFHRNDGKGTFEPGEEIVLPGPVTAMVTGDVNRRDGLTDIVVGVEASDGPRALVFEWPEGALRGSPEVLELPGPARAMALGQIDNHYGIDLVVAAGQDLVVVTGRDRKLSWIDSVREAVPRAEMRNIPLASPAVSLEIGRFSESEDSRMRLAMMDATGRLQVAPLDDLDSLSAESGIIQGIGTVMNSGEVQLIKARVASDPGEDLVLLDRSSKQLRILPTNDLRPATPGQGQASAVAAGPSFFREVDGLPVAVIPMRLNTDALSDLVVLSDGPASLSTVPTTSLTTFVVTNVNDSGPGSLRQAIEDANAAPGSDEIHFSIPGSPPHTIMLSSGLPSLLETATLDGTTEPDFAGTPVIEVATVSPHIDGIVLNSDSNVVRGLAINRTDPAAIYVLGDSNLCEGNFVGTDTTGATILSNNQGIRLEGSFNTIGGTAAAARNVISGNVVRGCLLFGQENTIAGNYVGTDVTGTVPLGNSAIYGDIEIFSGGINNTIGGTVAGAANLVSGSDSAGIGIHEIGCMIQGNLIGTDHLGTSPIPNSLGVFIGSGETTLGGTTPTARNVISASVSVGVHVYTGANTVIQGNNVGVDISGLVPMGNMNEGGIKITASDSLVGGSSSGRNVISGNAHGVTILGAANNVIAGNRIGVDLAGTTALGNTGWGVGILDGSNNTIEGFNVISSNGSGVRISGAGSTNNLVDTSYIGTDITGAVAMPNVDGVKIDNGASANQIGMLFGGNTISGNTGNGVLIQGSTTTGNVLDINKIGLDSSGTIVVPNGLGVLVDGSPGNIIGSYGNDISGNTTDGIRIVGPDATGNIVQSNFIGTDLMGSLFGNGEDGVSLRDAAGNMVGGGGPFEANLISGNNGSGVFVEGSGAVLNVIKGNLIGTDASSTGTTPNGIGILINGASNNTIGGPGSDDGNIVSGNPNNLVIALDANPAANNHVEGNYFGVDNTATVPVGSGASNVALVGAESTVFLNNIVGGNHTRGLRILSGMDNVVQGNMFGVGLSMASIGLSGPGILIEGSSSGNLIGGTMPGAGNIIANNADNGIQNIGTGTDNSIRGNFIDVNGGLGIDLGPNGVTPNDPEVGPNMLQNFPVLTAADATGGSVTVSGSLSTFGPGLFEIDFFAGPSCDPSGHGEGATYLGTISVITDGGGIAAFMATVIGPVSAGDAVTATATDFPGNTSEFSACATAVGVAPAAMMSVGGLGGGIGGTVFSWDPVPGATSYHVYMGAMSTVPDLADPVADSCQYEETTALGTLIPARYSPPPGETLWVIVRPEGIYGLGEPAESSSGPRVHDSTGDCGSSCAHHKCVVDDVVPLTAACDPCVAMICDVDPFCCLGGWDGICEGEVFSVCGSLDCPSTQGTCAHTLCTAGSALTPGCDSPPAATSCVAAICAVDPYCCDTEWDSFCQDEVATVCGLTCL